MKVRNSQLGAPFEQALLNAAVVGPGALGPDGRYVELRNEPLSVTQLLQKAEQRVSGIKDAGLFDARAKTSANLRPAENSRSIRPQHVIGERQARRCFHAEDRVFLDAGAERVIKALCEGASRLQGVAGVPAVGGALAETGLREAALGFIAKPEQRGQLWFDLVFGLRVNKIAIRAGRKLIGISLNELKERLP